MAFVVVILSIWKNGKELKLSFEFGGGNCVAIIYVPTVNEWPNKTEIDINERGRVLEYIAMGCIKDKAPNCHFELRDDRIVLFSNQ
jgi:hypothetical protein